MIASWLELEQLVELREDTFVDAYPTHKGLALQWENPAEVIAGKGDGIVYTEHARSKPLALATKI